MLKKANITWSVKQYCKMMEKDTVTFDNAVQRTLVWKADKKSLLIDSVLRGYPIPAFYATRTESGYDMLDGKQRSNAFFDYKADGYALTELAEIELENGEVLDISGKKFSELPEELQDKINSHMLTVYYYENITEEQISELFFRLNNGQALSAIELSRVKAKSKAAIQQLGQHELFKSALTEKAMARYTNEDIVIKTYAVLYEKDPSLETKYIRPLMAEIEITEEQLNEMTEIYNKICKIHSLMAEKKAAKRLLTRTHLISIVPVIKDSINNGVDCETMKDWAEAFFAGTKSATVSAIYNDNAGSGSARKEAVRKRLEEVKTHYENFMKKNVTAEHDSDRKDDNNAALQ